MNPSVSSRWIQSPGFDLLWIIGPAFFSSAVVLILFPWTGATSNISPFLWLIFVLGIDVSHVYATLFRTYWNSTEKEQYRTVLFAAPLTCWLVGVVLYSVSPLYFWRVLAYLAAFHFVRQQYGFFAIYAKKNGEEIRLIDKLAIYSPMLFALTYWHTHLPREFHWFVEGDFLAIPAKGPETFVLAAWVGSWLVYGHQAFRNRKSATSWGKHFTLLGTALSWNVGIVLLDSDLAFTLTNVTAHGIPYFALLWIYGKQYAKHHGDEACFGRLTWRQVFSGTGVIAYWGILFSLAYLEEGLWDGFVWREHAAIFPLFSHLPVVDGKSTQAWLIPLLTLPQATHYVLDGFIWRIRQPRFASSQWFEANEVTA